MMKIVPSPSTLIGEALIQKISTELNAFEDALDLARHKPDNFDEIVFTSMIWMAIVSGYDTIHVDRMVHKVRSIHSELLQFLEPTGQSQ